MRLKGGAFMDCSSKVYTINEVKEVIENIVSDQYPEINRIILFGSYSRNDANCKSDLDLCIDSPKNVKARVVYTLIGRLKEVFNKPIDLFRKNDIDMNSTFYKSIEEEGIIIYEKHNKE